MHHFTVDVEEHFQVTALERTVARADWDSQESRVARSTRVLLDLMARYEARGTFFVLGWVAERQRELVREMAAGGHEIASHGWDHARVPTQTREQFRESIRRTRALLEDLTGQTVYGFRAPSFSIIPGTEWALDVLIEEGHRYDSSLFPIRRRGYGYPSAQRDPHPIDRPAGRLVEVPPATMRIGAANLPAGGGGYFRLLPYALTHAAFTQAAQRSAPATFYIHPWELDVDQPRLRVPALTRLRHYGGLHRTAQRLERLLGTFSFRPIAETLDLPVPANS